MVALCSLHISGNTVGQPEQNSTTHEPKVITYLFVCFMVLDALCKQFRFSSGKKKKNMREEGAY